MSSHFRYSFLPSALDPASSTGFQSPTPFIPNTQVPYSAPLSCDTRWPGSQGPSFIQSPPNLTNTMPSIPVLQDSQTQVSSKAADSIFSPPANGPVADYQPHGSLSPYTQHSPFPCTDSEADPTEKRPSRPRASNAFILFRSDFLRRKLISKGQEARQHKLSIIAAKCWHKLTREEKRRWFLEAEREKKAHALKYGDYQTQARTRARTRRESRIMVSPGELEHLGRLADMAYQEIINDTPARPASERTTSLSTSMTTALASGPPSSTQGCYQEQELPFSFSSGEVGQLALPQGYQLPQKASLGDFSTFQDADMFPNTGFDGMYPATIARPASAPMCSTAGSISEIAARQPITLPSESVLRGFTSIYDLEMSNYFTMFGGSSSLPHDIIPSSFSGLAST